MNSGAHLEYGWLRTSTIVWTSYLASIAAIASKSRSACPIVQIRFPLGGVVSLIIASVLSGR